MPKKMNVGKSKQATGKAVFNTNKDSEFSKELSAKSFKKEATGTAVFNTNKDRNN